MGRPKYKYDEEILNKIKKLANKGFNDTEIVKRTGANYAFIQKTTTQYWKDKMKQKKEKEK